MSSPAYYTASPPTLAEGQPNKLRLTSTGALVIDGAVTATGGATAANQTLELAALDLLKQPTRAVAVTASDATDTTATATKGCWVGTGGDLAVKFVGDSAGSAVTLKNVPSGTYVPGAFCRVMSTNTTASNIVSFYGP